MDHEQRANSFEAALKEIIELINELHAKDVDQKDAGMYGFYYLGLTAGIAMKALWENRSAAREDPQPPSAVSVPVSRVD